jgi:ABC-2 type transport system permease protein
MTSTAITGTARTTSTRMPSVGRLLVAQVSYQARLLASGRAVTIGVGFPVILLISSHGQHARTGAADIASYAAFGLSLTAWNTYGIRLVAAREAGVLKRWRATPLPRWCYFLGRILATVVVAVAAGAATVAASVLLYGTHLSLSGILAALVVFVLGALAWAATATALTAAVPTVEAAGPTLMLTYFPLIIISGTFGAISEPHWLATIASYLPAQPLVHALGSSLGHTAGHALLPARDLLVLAAWAIAGLAVAVATFRWEPHRPTRQRPQTKSPMAPHGARKEVNGDLSDTTAGAVLPPAQGLTIAPERTGLVPSAATRRSARVAWDWCGYSR